MKTPDVIRNYILKVSKGLSDDYKNRHTLYGLEDSNKKRKEDKTYIYARKNKLSRVQMWNLAIRLLNSKDLEYLPEIKLDKEDPFHPNVVLYAYVYRKRPMYIKYYVNSKIINLRSLHPTDSKDNRFKSLKE